MSGSSVSNLGRVKFANSRYSVSDFELACRDCDENNNGRMILWTLGTLFVSLNVGLSYNLGGICVVISWLELFLLLTTNYFLQKGLRQRSWPYMAPWTIFSMLNMYYNQLNDILRIYQVLLHNRVIDCIPWVTFIVYCLCLAMRIQLTARVLLVAIENWYNKKLERQLMRN